MMTRLKAHNPVHQFPWLAADQTDNSIVEMAALLAPSDLPQDSIASARSQQKYYSLI